jgi:hypothetical protein
MCAINRSGQTAPTASLQLGAATIHVHLEVGLDVDKHSRLATPFDVISESEKAHCLIDRSRTIGISLC